MSENKQVTIVTHSSSFHTDDIFAVATLILAIGQDKDIEVVRSRDMAVIEKGDYVADVGGIHDEFINRFDHHQIGGAGKRENGIPYAAFGLVWKKFGTLLSGSVEAASKIDTTFVQSLDALDNGVQVIETKIPGVFPYTVTSLVSMHYPTWKENDSDMDAIFMELVSYAKSILTRLIVVVKDDLEGEKLVVEAYHSSADKRLIFLEDSYPWEEVLSKFSEPLFVVYQNKDKNWSIKAIRDNPVSYQSRKILPEKWAGKRDEELEKVTGIPGSIFCHNARFMAVAKTKEAILKMAEIAINS